MFIIFSILTYSYLLTRVLIRDGANYQSIKILIQVFTWFFFSQFLQISKIHLKTKTKSAIHLDNFRNNIDSLNKDQWKSKHYSDEIETEKERIDNQIIYQDRLTKIQNELDKNKFCLSQIIPFDSERFNMIIPQSKEIDQINENNIQSILLENVINDVSIGIIIIDGSQQIHYHNQQALSFFNNCTKKNLKQKLFQWETRIREQQLENQIFQRKKSSEQQDTTTRKQQINKDTESKKVNANVKRSQSFGNYSITNISKLDYMIFSENKETMLPLNYQTPQISSPILADNTEFKRSFQQDNFLGFSSDRSNIYNLSQQIDMLDQSRNHLSPPNLNMKSSIRNRKFQKEYYNFRKTDLSGNSKLIGLLKSGKRLLAGEIIQVIADLQNYKTPNFKPFQSDQLLENKTTDEQQLSEEYIQNGRAQTQYTIKDKQKRIDYSISNNILSIKMIDEKDNHVMVHFKSYYCYEEEQKQSDTCINLYQKEKQSIMITIEIIESCFKPSDLIDIQQFNFFKKKILSSVSHELRTPLNCSIQLLDILQNSDILQETQKKMFITPALNSNQLLLCMINDILDFAQIANGQLKLSFTTFNMIDTIRECISYFTIQAAFKNIQIDFNFDPKVPQIIHSDPMRLKQVVINLMNNAVKFTTNGSISVCLDLVEKDLIKIQIIDTGCGVPSEVGSQIFKGCEDQKKIDKDVGQNLNTEGAGLGLTIANNIAMGLGGNRKIECISEVDVGSIFSFYIINRSIKMKGCYFNHLKIFSHSYSLWRSLYDQSKDESLSNSSLEQSRKEWLLKTKPSSQINSNLTNQISRDSINFAPPQFISQQDIHKHQQNDQPKKRLKLSIKQHLSPEDRKQIQIQEEIPQESNTSDNSSDQDSSSYKSKESPLNFKNITKTNSDINKNWSQIALQRTKQNSMSIQEHQQSQFQIASQNKNFLSPNQDEEGCNISSEDSIQYKQNNTINQNSFSVAHKKKRKQNLYIQTNKIKKRSPSLFSEIEKENFKTQQIGIKQQNSVNLKRIRDSQLDNLQSDIYMFISNSSLQSTQQKIASPIKLNEEKLLRYNPNQQNRLRKFSTDPIAEGVLKQLQMELNKEPAQNHISSQGSLSPTVKIKKKETNGSNKNVYKMATISEESFTNFPKGIQTKVTISYDQQLPNKNIQNLSTNNLSLPSTQAKICQCPKILIVDDNYFNLLALELRLKEYQYAVDKANSGFDALDKVSNRLLDKNSCCKYYQLIFMDIDMPQKNGYETTEEIISFYKKQNEKCCPISACTAFIQEEDKQKAFDSGMSYYLTKPVLSKKLEEILQQVFNQ